MDEVANYIKFNCVWVEAEPIPWECLAELDKWRSVMHSLSLIGVYDDGVGFGNISRRIGDSDKFIITGSATGGIEKLTEQHYTAVMDYNTRENRLTCEGPIRASSESLTHAAIYESDRRIKCVLHSHDLELWESLLGNVPTTSADVPYGTPEMADEVRALCLEEETKKERIVCMAGHREGIITFGKNFNEAGKTLMRYQTWHLMKRDYQYELSGSKVPV